MHKALNILKNIVVTLITLAALGMMAFTIFSVTTFDQADRSVFGYRFFIVQSDSMSATDFSAGDIVFTKEVDPAALAEGDIIAYVSQDDASYGEVVTHKIRALTTTDEGEPGFITYGTTTNTDDACVVAYENVLGKYVGSLPGVGTFFAFLKSVPGYVLCILLPFLVLIAYYGVRCVTLFRRLRREQAAELQLEKQQLAEERRQLEAMRMQLQNMQSGASRQAARGGHAYANANVLPRAGAHAQSGAVRAGTAAVRNSDPHALRAASARSDASRAGVPRHAAQGGTPRSGARSANSGDSPFAGFSQDRRSTNKSNRR